MLDTIIGKKLEQTQGFLTNGIRIPITKVLISDYPVVSVKTKDKNGYCAVQLGFGKRKKPTKAILGQIKGANLENAPFLFKEVKFKENEEMPKVGDIVKALDVLKPGDVIDASGISKGKGFAGGVKRWGFKGGPRTHGQSDRERAPGSIGQTTTPGRVYKGKKMAGKMGYENVTIKNLEVIDISGDSLWIKGLIPGARNTFVVIKKVSDGKKFVPLFKEEIKSEKPAAAENIETEKELKEEKVQEEVKAEIKEDIKEENG